MGSSCCPGGGRRDNSPMARQSRETPLWPARSSSFCVWEPVWLTTETNSTHYWWMYSQYLLCRGGGEHRKTCLQACPPDPALWDGRGSPFRLHVARWPLLSTGKSPMKINRYLKTKKKSIKNFLYKYGIYSLVHTYSWVSLMEIIIFIGKVHSKNYFC